MARLVVNPDTADSWEQELPPGAYTIGRAESNHVVLEHPSVSTEHCELTITPNSTTLRDLGSTGGTFVDGQLIESTPLHANQLFTVGEVQLKYLPDPPLARPRPVAAAPRGKSQLGTGTTFASAIAHTRVPGDDDFNFYRHLPGTLAYPFTGSGPILLGAGAIFFLVIGFLPLIAAFFGGYLFAYAKGIVAASAQGEDSPPDWPDFTNWTEDILMPYLHMIALIALTFAPAMILAIFLPENQPLRWVIVAIAFLYGIFLAPMGMLALSMFDTVTALNPIPLVISIGRIPVQYTVATIAFGLAIGAYMFAGPILSLIPVPFLPAIVAGFVSLYFLTVAMRILGLLYRANKHRLAWFSR